MFTAVVTTLIYFDKSGLLFGGFLALLIHEFGHIFAMIYKKHHIKKIELIAFGVEIINTSKNTIFVLLSGAVANFIVAGIFILVYNFFETRFLKIFAIQNMCLGILNLLPVGNLDGGQILFLILQKIFRLEVCEKILMVISFLIILPIAFLGFLILIRTRYNFSLLFLACYLMMVLINKEMF